MNFFRKIYRAQTFQYTVLVLLAVAAALDYEIFIFPNRFAPAGINGLATMVQFLLGISVGYLSLIVNIPLLIAAFFRHDRFFAIKTLVYILVFSGVSIAFRAMDLSDIVFVAEDGGGALLAAIAGGFFYGLIYSVAIRMGGSTGGTDIMAAFINRRHPEFNVVWIIFSLDAVIAVLSFFVYGMDYQPVILCIVYCFFSSRTSDTIFKGARSAAKFEVVTTHAEDLAHELIEQLHHGCTLIPAKGVYSNTDKQLLICIVNRRQVVDFENIIRKYNDTFAFVSTVSGTLGNFQHIK